MSQEASGSGRNRRRDSILKTRQVVDVEVEEKAAGGKKSRRVSFRNLKEVQYYDTDTKNCPDLLHDASPVKEKINDTLGSDGVMTPGRSSTVHSSGSRNNTLDMFGDRAKKPIPMANETVVEKFEVNENVARMETTSYSCVDMSITMNESQNSRIDDPDSTLQMFNKTTALNSSDMTGADRVNLTIDMFRPSIHPIVEEPEHNTTVTNAVPMDVSANDTMQLFRKSEEGDQSPLNDTMKMFQSAPENPMNSTMMAFKSPARKTDALDDTMNAFIPVKRAEAGMNTTMDMFTGMNEAPTSTKKKRISLSSTLQSIQPKLDEEKVLNETFDMFRGSNKELSHTNTANTSCVDMDITAAEPSRRSITGIQGFEAVDADMDNTEVTPVPRSNGTLLESIRESDSSEMALDRDETLQLPSTKSNISFVPTAEGDLNSTMNLFAGAVNLVEENRKMDVSIVNSVDRRRTAENLISKTPPRAPALPSADETDMNISNITTNPMNVSSTSVADRTLRATNISQSSRSRRRSSLGSTMRDISMRDMTIENTLRVGDPNTSVQEQLSFTFRNTLFNCKAVKLPYDHSGDPLTNEYRAKAAGLLEQIVVGELDKTKVQLEKAMLDVTDKCPEKKSALENLNGRKLGALDRDVMKAGLARAEEKWFKIRSEVAQKAKEDAEKIVDEMERELVEAKKKALLCEKRVTLEAEVSSLQKELGEASRYNPDEMAKLDEEEAQLQKEIDELELRDQNKTNEELRSEIAYMEKRREHLQTMKTVIDAMERECEANTSMLKRRLKLSGGSLEDLETTSSMTATENIPMDMEERDDEELETATDGTLAAKTGSVSSVTSDQLPQNTCTFADGDTFI